jgi:peptide/nickel transport system permease protein
VLAFLVRRVALALIVLVAVSFGSFWFFARNFYITPGTLLPVSAQQAWWDWFKGIPNGSIGKGVFGQDLWPSVLPAFGHTLLLLAFAFVLVLVFALLVGTLCAVREGSVADVALRTLSYASWGVPAFLLALIMQRVLAIAWAHIHAEPLPLHGWPGACVNISDLVNQSDCGVHGWPYVAGLFEHLALPSIALAASFIGLHARYVRSSLLVALGAPYTTTARAKGLPERRVVRHALRNSLVTFVSALLLDFGAIFGAAMAVDWIFGLNGIGSLFIQLLAGTSVDPNAVQLVLLLTATLVLASSLLAELAVGWLDPRVRLR